MRSLRARLFVFLLLLGVLASIAVGSATYVSVHEQADELFDYHLRQMALSLRDQGHITDAERAGLDNPELDYVVQVWSMDGVALYSSQPRESAPLPPRTTLGLSNVQAGGITWRVYGAATPARVVQVAQPLAVRRQLATSAAWRSVLPIVVAAPLLGLALWWLVGLMLAPLQRVVAAASRRDAHSLAPLPLAGLPSEIEPLVQAFNQLLSRLAGAFEAQRAFVADAAHELQTPLTTLRLQLGLVRDAHDADDRQTALDRLRAGVDRAARLVDQLLTLARAEPGHAWPVAEFELTTVLRLALGDSAALAAQHHASVTLDAPAACTMHCNAAALQGLVRNLVDNAILHGGARPQVVVQLRCEGNHALLRVDDDGPGIPMAERERVFARFHRGADGRDEGSGLGLAIVRTIAERHGGRVSLAPSPLGGLRVQVQLPLAAPPRQPPPEPAAS